ncbi:hypothetical protein CF386_08585 [Paraphotobacterium marinum]|uniref:N-acetyltransferase domain-containing protein n=1 Tax=Paraphotobacterium marinum TaxID=1755811 RepID=A0A220VFI1_9GAMM|nr:GNAT family N-acetyltransferase [Paraphotobacterium marinum]ASK79117.1 hypothetical protein CF386_08585 [Paraphotobacterium marinum]
MVIEKENFYKLEKLHIDDATELFNLIFQNKNHLRKWLNWVDNTKHVSDTLNFIEMTLNKEKTTLSIVRKIVVKDKIIGLISLNDEGEEVFNLGYWLSHDYCNKGLMTLIVKNFISTSNLKFSKSLIIRAQPLNIASNKIAKNCGFHFEHMQKNAEIHQDKFIDLNIYKLMRK